MTQIKTDIHILCVEDDKLNQVVVKMMLNMLGYKQVSFTEDKNSTLEFLENKANKVDFILMDIGLPGGVSGIDLTKIIREKGLTDAPIIALTGNDEENTRNKCIAAGMAAFLSKPLDKDALGEILNTFFLSQDSVA
jgi:CheY-like chemotaxis protein